MSAFPTRRREWLEIARASVDDAHVREANAASRRELAAARADELRATAEAMEAEARQLLADAKTLRQAADVLHEFKLVSMRERIEANADRTRAAIAADLARIGGTGK